MNFASEIINDVTRKARRRLVLIIILVTALIISNLCWIYKEKQLTAYVSEYNYDDRTSYLGREVVPRKA